MYSIYNLITGKIKRHVISPEVNPGEGAIAGKFDPEKYQVKQGIALPIPPQPYPGTEYDYLLERWVDKAGQDTRMLIAERNHKLRESDWTDTASFRSRMGDAVADAWLDYRQKLRDITKHPGFPMNFYWPEPPK